LDFGADSQAEILTPGIWLDSWAGWTTHRFPPQCSWLTIGCAIRTAARGRIFPTFTFQTKRCSPSPAGTRNSCPVSPSILPGRMPLKNWSAARTKELPCLNYCRASKTSTVIKIAINLSGNASPRWIFRSWPIPAASFASAASATTSNLPPASGCRLNAG